MAGSARPSAINGSTGQLTQQREGGAHLVAPTTKPHSLPSSPCASATMPWLFQRHCQARSSSRVRPASCRVARRLHLHQHGRQGQRGRRAEQGARQRIGPSTMGCRKGAADLPLHAIPRAKMWGSLVCSRSSTRMPRSTASPAPRARARFGRRPIAAITRSCSLMRPSVRVTRQPSPAGHLSWRDPSRTAD